MSSTSYILWGLGALSGLVGCASQGPLRPPSLKLPAAVKGLAAARSGDAVNLQWTAPTRTSDGIGLEGRHGAGPLTTEICRESARSAGPCSPIARVPTTAGAAGQFQDTLPVSLVKGPPVLLFYRVRVVNGLGRGAGYSRAEAVAGSAPPTVAELGAEPVIGGVALRWRPEPGTAGDRTLLRVLRGNVPAGPEKPNKGEILLAVGPAPGKAADGAGPAEMAGGPDPGGVVDTGARPGIAQHYTVTRVQTVQLDGRQYTLSSVPASVTVPANAAPATLPAPAGLEAVANTLGTPQIDLVWQPVAGASGYLVYRAAPGEAAHPLTATPLPGLTYADTAAIPGIRYRYSVSAVSPKAAPSPRSSEASEELPRQ